MHLLQTAALFQLWKSVLISCDIWRGACESAINARKAAVRARRTDGRTDGARSHLSVSQGQIANAAHFSRAQTSPTPAEFVQKAAAAAAIAPDLN